jgi:hypothetical protein
VESWVAANKGNEGKAHINMSMSGYAPGTVQRQYGMTSLVMRQILAQLSWISLLTRQESPIFEPLEDDKSQHFRAYL